LADSAAPTIKHYDGKRRTKKSGVKKYFQGPCPTRNPAVRKCRILRGQKREKNKEKKKPGPLEQTRNPFQGKAGRMRGEQPVSAPAILNSKRRHNPERGTRKSQRKNKRSDRNFRKKIRALDEWILRPCPVSRGANKKDKLVSGRIK